MSPLALVLTCPCQPPYVQSLQMDIEFSYYNLTLRELVDMDKEIHVRQLHIVFWLAYLTRAVACVVSACRLT